MFAFIIIFDLLFYFYYHLLFLCLFNLVISTHLLSYLLIINSLFILSCFHSHSNFHSFIILILSFQSIISYFNPIASNYFLFFILIIFYYNYLSSNFLYFLHFYHLKILKISYSNSFLLCYFLLQRKKSNFICFLYFY